MKSSRGFTLIEILYAMVIIAILCGVAAPFFRNWLADIELRSVSRQLQSDLMWARSQAISLNTDIVVDMHPVGDAAGCIGSGGGYTIFADNGAGGGTAGDGVKNGSEPVLKTVVFPTTGGPCLNMSTTSPAGQPVGFTSRGLPLAGLQAFPDASGNSILSSIQVASTRTTTRLSTCIRLAGSVFTQTP